MTPLGKWVISPPRKTLVVGVADMVASNDSSAELATYSLGSCLGITVFDPIKKVGGLLHIMLPESKLDLEKAAKVPYMFVDSGVPRLFQAVCNMGADRKRLIIRAAGGAQLLDEKGIFNIGERNCLSLKALLARNGYALQAEDFGGLSSRTLRLDLATGKISIKTPGTDLYYL